MSCGDSRQENHGPLQDHSYCQEDPRTNSNGEYRLATTRLPTANRGFISSEGTQSEFLQSTSLCMKPSVSTTSKPNESNLCFPGDSRIFLYVLKFTSTLSVLDSQKIKCLRGPPHSEDDENINELHSIPPACWHSTKASKLHLASTHPPSLCRRRGSF